MHQKTQKRKHSSFIKIIALFLSIAALLAFIFYFYIRSQSKVIKQDILPNNYSFSIEYNPNNWTYKQIQGNPEGNAFGYYASAINLYSTKTYTEDNGEQKPIYEIHFRFEKNINAYVEVPKPGEEGWTGADNTKPEKPLPFKKDDFEYVTTVNGRELYIAKDGNFTDKYISSSDSFIRVSMPMRDYDAGAVLEKYHNNTLSDYLDIFSDYSSVFNGQEKFSIVYIINDPSGSWQELKPELVKILKSMKVENVK